MLGFDFRAFLYRNGIQLRYENNHRLLFDLINKDYPNYGTLKARIRNNKELYKNIKALECVIKDELFIL